MKFTPLALALVCTSLLPTETSAHRIQLSSFAPDIAQRYVHRLTERFNAVKKAYVPHNAAAMSQPVSHHTYLTEASSDAPLKIAQRFVKERLHIGSDGYKVSSMYTSKHNGVTHIYLKQVVDGLEVANGDFNINIDRTGRVVSYGDAFYRADGKSVQLEEGDEPSSSTGRSHPKKQKSFIMQLFGNDNAEDDESDAVAADEENQEQGHQVPFPPAHSARDRFIDAGEAVLALAKYLKVDTPPRDRIVVTTETSLTGEPQSRVLGFSFTETNGIPVVQKFIHFYDKATRQSRLRRVWDIVAEMEENWFHAHVDAVTGEVVSLNDWVSDASYEVYPLGVNDPADGERKVVHDPANKEASPFGWHGISKTKSFTTTRGNNVMAQENLDGSEENDLDTNFRPDGGKELKFEYAVNLKKEPSTYLNASITNLFYWNNIMHDLFYQYGFDEQSGNFQKNNNGRGGKGGDEVIANAQDGSGYNNANFATPPDGQNGKMRMYVWDQTKPKRDGDMEAGIIIHEYAHGISTRLTGGPMNSNCLGWGEAGGMGEGWGDFFATALRMRPEYNHDNDFAMGSYSFGQAKGIRKYIYSTDMTTNPSTYKFIKRFGYFGVHAKGEVWAVMLYDMYWNLVDAYGFSEDWYNPQAKGTKSSPAGNVVALQLVIDGMKMQPCSPNFVNARDAILQADEVNYQGMHFCEIWKAFAKRGLGLKAKKGGNEDFSLPDECNQKN